MTIQPTDVNTERIDYSTLFLLKCWMFFIEVRWIILKHQGSHFVCFGR